LNSKSPKVGSQNWKSGGRNLEAKPSKTYLYAIAFKGRLRENLGVSGYYEAFFQQHQCNETNLTCQQKEMSRLYVPRFLLFSFIFPG
jgi:hypothetical protein